MSKNNKNRGSLHMSIHMGGVNSRPIWLILETFAGAYANVSPKSSKHLSFGTHFKEKKITNNLCTSVDHESF